MNVLAKSNCYQGASPSLPYFCWYSSRYLYTKSLLWMSFNNPASNRISVGEKTPWFSIYPSKSNAEHSLREYGRSLRNMITWRSSDERCSESSTTSFLYSEYWFWVEAVDQWWETVFPAWRMDWNCQDVVKLGGMELRGWLNVIGVSLSKPCTSIKHMDLLWIIYVKYVLHGEHWNWSVCC